VRSAGPGRGRGHRGHLYRVADLVERAGVTVDDLLGQGQGHTDTDQVSSHPHYTHKLTSAVNCVQIFCCISLYFVSIINTVCNTHILYGLLIKSSSSATILV